jgi:hypothetical protein
MVYEKELTPFVSEDTPEEGGSDTPEEGGDKEGGTEE